MTEALSGPRCVGPEDLAHPHPIYVVWEITLRCDQACRHCGSRAGVPREQELSTAEALDLVDQLAAVGVREVALIGGEAYLRPDWLVIVAALVKHGMRCILVSGGRGLHEGQVAAAAAAGLASVAISIDGLPATHDQLRAVPGSWHAATAALQRVAAAGIIPTVNSQINRANRHEFEALAALLLPLGVKAWQLQLTTPMGRAADRERLLLQPWHMLSLMPRLARLAQTASAQGCQVMAADNLGYFGPHEEDLRLGAHWSGCPAGRFSIGIQSDGFVKACASLPAQPYAEWSVRQRPLAQILAESPSMNALRERRPASLRGFCADCYYADLCLGGCVWTSHTFHGAPGDMPYCHHRALELRAQGLRERLVQTTPAPGGGFDVGQWRTVVEPWREED